MRSCPICKKSGYHFGTLVNSDARIGKYVLKVNKCQDCQFVYQSPLFDKKISNDIYSKNFIGYEAKQRKYIRNMSIRRKGLAELFSSFINQGDLVAEIGCSSGFILHGMSQIKKCDYFGFDLDKNAIEFGRRFFKNIHLSTDDFFKVEKSWNAIILSHVFEHIEDPIYFLRKISEKISHNGKIIISVPNSKMMFEAPFWEHTNYFSPISIEKIANMCGLSVEFSKEWTSENNEQELTFCLSKNKKINATLKCELDSRKVKSSSRIGIRNWYDATPSKEKAQFSWLNGEYRKNGYTFRVHEWLLWSKLYRFFVKK